jgi:hypothetical protein
MKFEELYLEAGRTRSEIRYLVVQAKKSRELLSKLEIPIHMLLARYKGKERKEKQKRTSRRQTIRVI